MQTTTSWKDCWSLRDYIVYLIAGNLQNTSEYKTMVSVFGEAKIQRIWADYLAKMPPRMRDPGDDDD